MVITILIMGIMAVTVDGISDGIFHKDTEKQKFER